MVKVAVAMAKKGCLDCEFQYYTRHILMLFGCKRFLPLFFFLSRENPFERFDRDVDIALFGLPVGYCSAYGGFAFVVRRCEVDNTVVTNGGQKCRDIRRLNAFLADCEADNIETHVVQKFALLTIGDMPGKYAGKPAISFDDFGVSAFPVGLK